eukprot:103433-Chlamydomonas_euryale.AAC.2
METVTTMAAMQALATMRACLPTPRTALPRMQPLPSWTQTATHSDPPVLGPGRPVFWDRSTAHAAPLPPLEPAPSPMQPRFPLLGPLRAPAHREPFQQLSTHDVQEAGGSSAARTVRHATRQHAAPTDRPQTDRPHADTPHRPTRSTHRPRRAPRAARSLGSLRQAPSLRKTESFGRMFNSRPRDCAASRPRRAGARAAAVPLSRSCRQRRQACSSAAAPCAAGHGPSPGSAWLPYSPAAQRSPPAGRTRQRRPQRQRQRRHCARSRESAPHLAQLTLFFCPSTPVAYGDGCASLRNEVAFTSKAYSGLNC